MARKFEAHALLVLCLAILLAGCTGARTPTAGSATKRTAHLDPWVLTTLDPKDQTPALLWNGLVGFRIGRDGGGYGQPFFSIDEYDTTGEEKIRSMGSPLPSGFIVDGKALPITGDYRQSLDMKTSELTTHWQSDKATVDCVTVVHPSKKIVAQRWTLSGLDIAHTLDFDLGINGNLGKESLLSTDILVGPSKMRGKLIATQTTSPNRTVEVVITLGKSPNWEAMQLARGTKPVLATGWDRAPSVETFAQVEYEAKAVWGDRWKTDIEIDGPVEDQQAVRSFLFYLRSAIHPDGGMSISPFGLSNQMYNGHVFWDADIWVFPALAFIEPSEAQAITKYRLETIRAALQNYENPRGVLSNPPSAKFAWESSVSGKETAPGSSRKEIHVTGDVAWSAKQSAELGLIKPIDAVILTDSSATFYGFTAKEDDKNKAMAIRDVMSPDENHVGDNDLYTNLLAQWTGQGGSWTSRSSTHDWGNVYVLPHDDKSFLTYDGDPVKSYKQAAAVLSIYPLQYPNAEKEAKVMMERFSDKVSKNGPAMSDSVHGLIWARLGEIDKAYDAWQKSWQPFTKQPLLLFSEKRGKPTTYFTTGAGGSLQTVLFGFLGFRIDSIREPGAAWSKQLQGNSWLSIKPNLPKRWKSVKLNNFKVLGGSYSLTATHRPSGPDAAKVIQGD